MFRVAGFRLLIAAVGPVAAAALAVERSKPRVVRAARSTDVGWSLVYPTASRSWRLSTPDEESAQRRASAAGVLIGYARCSTDKQDLAAQRHTLRELGVSDDRASISITA